MKVIFSTVLLLAGNPLYSGPNEDLYNAIMQGDKAAVLMALETGADVNWKNPRYSRTFLEEALYIGKHQIARVLINRGADATHALGPFIFSCWDSGCSGQGDFVDLLVKNGVKIRPGILTGDFNSYSLINHMPVDVIEAFLRNGADPNAKYEAPHAYEGKSLMEVARRDQVKELLKKHGAKEGSDVN